MASLPSAIAPFSTTVTGVTGPAVQPGDQLTVLAGGSQGGSTSTSPSSTDVSPASTMVESSGGSVSAGGSVSTGGSVSMGGSESAESPGEVSGGASVSVPPISTAEEVESSPSDTSALVVWLSEQPVVSNTRHKT